MESSPSSRGRARLRRSLAFREVRIPSRCEKTPSVGGCYDPGDLPPTSVPDAFERSRILPRANQVSTGHLIAPVCALVPPFRIPHPRQQKTAIRMGTAVIGVWMRDSIKLRSCRRPASGKQGSTGALHQIGSNPSPPQIKKADTRMGICFSWQRMRDSNPRERSQSPVCYRYTNPLSAGCIILHPAGNVKLFCFFTS